jgi:predicted NAD/FAD-dependent oxidoreductase
MENVTVDVLIVGAGITGLMAGRMLQERGLRVVLVDKGRSVGGRLATRRIGPGRADHGAQFFTVRTPELQAWIDRWLAEGLVFRWSSGWSNGSLSHDKPDGHPRYAVRGGLNALAKRLAQGLDARVDVRLVALTAIKNGWQAQDENGRLYTGWALLLTPPVPQSLALLDKGEVHLSSKDRAGLERIAYAPCLAGMFWVDGLVHLPEPGALQRPDALISWIADNQRKGISPEATLITVHAGPVYSRQLWDAPEAEVLGTLREGLQPFLDPTATIREAQLKRWRYALPTTLHPEQYLVAGCVPTLVFAGDAFGWPRVEGAALSGLAAGDAIARHCSVS